MRSLVLAVVVALFACSTSFAADRYTTRKNVHGGFDIMKNGKYEGRAMPNVHGGYKYYLKNGKPTQAATFKGFSVPSKVGGGTTYHFKSSSQPSSAKK
jgi:hypothetical protein